MKIKEIQSNGQEQFEVLSDSGKTYTVTYCGSGDGDPEYVALWECNCLAGQHGFICKHAKVVADFCEDNH